MRTPPGGLRPALLALFAAALAFVALGITAPAARATKCNDHWELHPGTPGHIASCGQRVKSLQWLLGGHRPNVFREIKPTFKWAPNGAYGARTTHAVVAYKWRLGYPQKGQCGAPLNMASNPRVGPLFLSILEGRTTRYACWIALAATRLDAAKAAQPTAIAEKAIAYENHLVALGIHEIPTSSNRGPAISYPAFGVPALQSATGAYGEAWCVSTQQTVLKTLGYGTFAQDTAGVYFAVDYYAARNLVFAKPKVGSLVAFIDYDSSGHRIPGTGHMGFVTAVDINHQTFTYIAGNDGNAVSRRTIGWGSRPYAFIRLPGVA